MPLARTPSPTFGAHATIWEALDYWYNFHMVVYSICHHNNWYTVWPTKNGTVDTVNFSGLYSDQQFFFSPCWIEHLFLIIITPRSSNLVENFLFLMDCYCRDLPDFQSSEARLMTASAAHAPTHTSIQPATKKSQCQWRAWIVNPC